MRHDYRGFGTLLGALLVTTGLVLMSWPVVTWAYGQYWQDRLARDLPRATEPVTLSAAAATPPPKAALKASVSPKPARPRPSRPIMRRSLQVGEALARLRIDRIGLDAIVVEGADNLSLRKGPGHLPQTGQPGESRNCAIAAHRDGWFERLHEVYPGDPVWVETRDYQYKYTVVEKRVVTPDRGDLLNRGSVPALTLITCTGPGYPHSRYRLLVFCDLQTASPR